MSLKASCFAVKQQFYGHFLATRIFHLATEKKFQSPLGARIKKLISDPAPPPPQTMLKISHQFQNLTSTLYRGEGARQEYFSNDANGTPFKQSVPRLMAIVVGAFCVNAMPIKCLRLLRNCTPKTETHPKDLQHSPHKMQPGIATKEHQNQTLNDTQTKSPKISFLLTFSAETWPNDGILRRASTRG